MGGKRTRAAGLRPLRSSDEIVNRRVGCQDQGRLPPRVAPAAHPAEITLTRGMIRSIADLRIGIGSRPEKEICSISPSTFVKNPTKPPFVTTWSPTASLPNKPACALMRFNCGMTKNAIAPMNTSITTSHGAIGPALPTTLTICSVAAAADNPPRYLVLQPVYRGQATPVRTYAYAYGWFGAQPSSESSMHRNYSNTGTTWTYQP